MPDHEAKRISRFIEPFRVSPGSSVNLAKDFDPAFEAGIKAKKDGVALLNEGIELLADYQARLAAQDTYGVLVVLQALDAAGKDGTIRHVMTGLNPQGVRVESFKVPSTDPTTKRCSSSACTNRTSSSARCSRPTRAEITSGSDGTKRSTTGRATCP